jgi:membrane-associated phospholipid phosphatase
MVTTAAAEKRFYLKASLLFYLAWILVFEAVGKYAATLPTRDLTLGFDRLIPVAAVFVWPYELCYLFPFLPFFLVKDWHKINRAILAVILANLTAYVVYFALPISFPRPELGRSLSDVVLRLEQNFDFKPGANKLPSLHVAFAWIVYIICRKQDLKKRTQALILGGAMLITVSTLFTKQHIILDVVFGVAWAFVAWWASGFLYPRLADVEAEPRTALKQMFRTILPGAAVFLVALFATADILWKRIYPW